MTRKKENDNAKPLSRRELIAQLSESVKIIAGKVTAERVRTNGSDETRLKYARALAQLATPLLAAMRDEQLDEIDRRLRKLEEGKEPES